MMDLLEVTFLETQQHIRFSGMDIIGQRCLNIFIPIIESLIHALEEVEDKLKQQDH